MSYDILHIDPMLADYERDIILRMDNYHHALSPYSKRGSV